VLTEIESFCALARYASEAAFRLPAVLDQIDLIDLDQRIRMLARTVTPATVRSLDAIHLGTALRPRSLTSFVTYDAPARRGPRSRSADHFACLIPSGAPLSCRTPVKSQG
jgi:predicted nucleic acid-binding protein